MNTDALLQRTETPGWFTDPRDKAHETQIRWDGETWTGQTRKSDTALEPVPKWKRHPARFFTAVWLRWAILGLIINTAGAVIYANWHSRIVVTAVAALGATCGALAFAAFLNSRIRFDQVINKRTIIWVFFLAGVVGQVIVQTERLFHNVEKVRATILVVGPIEEISKLLVPVLLFAFGAKMFRNPRVGIATVVASASFFGIAEAAMYAWRGAVNHSLTTAEFIGGILLWRPLTDPFLHVVITGVFAAVAWRIWHLKGVMTWTWKVIGVLVFTMAFHDLVDSTDLFLKPRFVGLAVLLWIGMYLVFKHVSRNEVPPSQIALVPHRWRPTFVKRTHTRRRSEGTRGVTVKRVTRAVPGSSEKRESETA